MAIKIRCKDCRKKISMDEAFAGGVCRCPYCKATNVVPGERRQVRDDRPDRPDSPQAPAAGADARRTIPLAKPVKVQGILTLILLALLFGLSAFAAAYGLKMYKGRQEDTSPPPPPPPNPITDVAGVQVAGLALRTPVVYVIDASGSMGDFYDPAAVLLRHSVRTLAASDHFNIVCLTEGKVEMLSDGGWVAGRGGSDAQVKAFLFDRQPKGVTALRDGLVRALALKPGTVVVLAAKGVEDPDALIAQAQGADIRVYTVTPAGDPDAAEALEALSEKTAGKHRAFTDADLMDWLDEAPLLP